MRLLVTSAKRGRNHQIVYQPKAIGQSTKKLHSTKPSGNPDDDEKHLTIHYPATLFMTAPRPTNRVPFSMHCIEDEKDPTATIMGEGRKTEEPIRTLGEETGKGKNNGQARANAKTNQKTDDMLVVCVTNASKFHIIMQALPITKSEEAKEDICAEIMFDVKEEDVDMDGKLKNENSPLNNVKVWLVPGVDFRFLFHN
jgi:hypothetical protein